MTHQSVLITGASSGIGRECALLLTERGFQVFASVRTTPAAETLAREAGPSLHPLLMNVRDPATIQAAVATIRSAIDPDASFSIVNNAGITVAGPLELLETEALRDQLEVNLLGPHAVTRAFLPLIRERTGRIVFIGSLFGKLALPFVAPYAAAKFALEAVADSLSVELQRWGIRVSLLEPGNIATPIWGKSKTTALESLSSVGDDRYDLYREDLEAFERLTDWYAKSGIPPRRVAMTVLKALTSRSPRSRYKVGWDSRIYGTFGPLLLPRIRYRILRSVVFRR